MLFQPQCITFPCDPIDTNINAPTTRVPGTTGGTYPTYPVPPIIASDPYAVGNTGIAGGLTNGAPVPMFTATTSELDKYRLLFLIVGIAIGYYLLKR